MPLTNPVTVQTTALRLQSESANSTTVNASVTVVDLLAANANRRSASIFNTATSRLYIKCGTGASLTSFAAYIEPGGYYEVPTAYTGLITGIWASADANGRAMVTEFIDAVD